MNDYSTESARSAFEAWCVAQDGRFGLYQLEHGNYAAINTHNAWIGWQAALSAQPSPATPVDAETLWWLQDAINTMAEGGNQSHVRFLQSLHDSLSAQPSPGGRGDASNYWPEIDRILVNAYVAGSEGDELDMIAARKEIHAALAARQPAELIAQKVGDYRVTVAEDAITVSHGRDIVFAYSAGDPEPINARQPEGISAEWVLGYLTTDAPEESREAIRNAFAEFAALSSDRQPVGELITVEAVATVRRNSDGDRYIDWLTEGGIADLEVGDVLMVSDRAITDEDGSGEVYAAPPAQAVDDRFPNGLSDAIAYVNQIEELAEGLHTKVFGYESDGEASATTVLQMVGYQLAENPAQAVDLGQFRASVVRDYARVRELEDMPRILECERLLALIDSQPVRATVKDSLAVGGGQPVAFRVHYLSGKTGEVIETGKWCDAPVPSFIDESVTLYCGNAQRIELAYAARQPVGLEPVEHDCINCDRKHAEVICPTCAGIAWDNGRLHEFHETRELRTSLGDGPLDHLLPDEWHEKPLLRFQGAYDEGDSSVGMPGSCGNVLAADQGGTVLGDYLASRAAKEGGQ